jgi:hypothetical protein
MFRVEISYGGKRHSIVIPAYNEETMLTESFLEHLIRRAVEGFREQAKKDGAERAEAELAQARERVEKEIDALVTKARNQ